MSLSINSILKYSNLQMAAEAFLIDESGATKFTGKPLIDALKRGNDHNSKFSDVQAIEFAKHWVVVEHKKNTNTGFSGSLFRCILDDPSTGSKAGEVVLSFRSTEFVDDAVRDNLATNALEIKDTGWAWGQISDMEEWYAELSKKNLMSGFSVTGYSLGGHLATAFNLLHPRVAKEVVTFNGAGVGQVKTGDVTSVMKTFSEMRSNPALIDGRLAPSGAAVLYRTINKNLANGTWKIEDALKKAEDALSTERLMNPDNGGTDTDLGKDYSEIVTALKDIRDMKSTAVRISKLTSGIVNADGKMGSPAPVPEEKIEAEKLDYRLAVQFASKNTKSMWLLNGAIQAYTGKSYIGLDDKSDQFDVVADTSPSAVANSQWHLGTNVPIFIENQPLFRGGVPVSVVKASLDYMSVQLLVDNYAFSNFGDTHSLVLLVDSLSVQSALLRLAAVPEKELAATMINSILLASSNLIKQDGGFNGSGQGLAEGDVLENVVNALAGMFLGPEKSRQLVASADGNTWAKPAFDGKNEAGYTGRDRFYEVLYAITESAGYKNLVNKMHISGAKTSYADAKEDFGALLSVVYLAPFTLNIGTEKALAELQKTNPLLAEKWNKDLQLQTKDRLHGDANLSDDYLSSRALLAEMKQYYNKKNARYDKTAGSADLDAAPAGQYDSQNIIWTDRSTKLTVKRNAADSATKYVVYGTDTADGDIVGAERNDSLFGGGGDDVVSGAGGDDHLEGNDGADALTGGAGKDKLLGGSGNDKLDGGADNDLLNAGEGDDTYVFSGSYGNDVIYDLGGGGRVQIDGVTIGKGIANGKRDQWRFDMGGGVSATLSLMDDPESSTGKKLVIVKGNDSKNSVTIGNFDLAKAQTSGYLGIQLDGAVKAAIKVGGGGNVWNQPGFDGSLSGSTELVEGTGRTFTLYLNQAAKAGQTVTLKIGGTGDSLKAILGDITVPASGALIALVEGQTQVSFALVQEGPLSADASATVGASVSGKDGPITTNTFNLVLKNSAEFTRTLRGDQSPPLQGEFYDWSETEWLADGTMSNGVAQPNFFDVLRAGPLRDRLLGMGGNDALDGAGDADYIDGGDGDDMIGGGQGSDYLLGGAGNDHISSSSTLNMPRRTSSKDTWKPPEGMPLVTAGANWGVYVETVNGIPVNTWDGANDPVGADSDYIDGGAGDDVLISSDGADRVLGGTGNDKISGRAGDDVLEGNDGDDNIDGDGTTVQGFINSVSDSIHGHDFLDGGAGADTLSGDGGSDVLFGGVDNDRLFGDSAGRTDAKNYAGLQYHGEDYLDGEDGDDYIEGGARNDTLYGGLGVDILWGDTYAANLSSPADNALIWGDDYLDGEEGNDILHGGGGNDALFGGAGDDKLWGDSSGASTDESYIKAEFQGNDYLDGEDGKDFLQGGGKNDTLYGGAGDDTLLGDMSGAQAAGDPAFVWGNDYLVGEDGKDNIEGGGGDDTLSGGSGNDVMFGDEGRLTLNGKLHGNDLLEGGEGDDQLVGGGGKDSLIGGTGNDFMWGDDEAAKLLVEWNDSDFLDGGDGNDQLVGGGGDDVLLGGAGDDILDGGSGADILDGGEGDDRYNIDNIGDVIRETAPPAPATAGKQSSPAGGLDPSGSALMMASPSAAVVAATSIDNVTSSISYQLGDNLENLTLTGNGSIDGSGNELANSITGNAQGNTLAGGGANDWLTGGAGNDVYLFNRGDGVDGIDNTDLLRDTANPATVQAVDVLRFGAGISESDIIAQRFDNDMVFSIGDSSDRIFIKNHYGPEVVDGTKISDRKIDRIEFANGVVWSAAQVEARIVGQQNNTAPVRGPSIPSLSARAGMRFSYTLAAANLTDTDANDKLHYRVTMNDGSAAPDWLKFDAATRTLSGVPDVASVGNLQVQVTATDNAGASASIGIGIGIGGVNLAPVAKLVLNDVKTGRDMPLSYTLPSGLFVDPDNDAMTYSVTLDNGASLPSWLNFNAGNRLLSGTPSTLEHLVLAVLATDANGLSGRTLLKIDVENLPFVLIGTPGNDKLYGSSANDPMDGKAGDDRLESGAGNDTLAGGTGNDDLIGGAGADTYRFNKGDGKDTISDASPVVVAPEVDRLEFGAGVAPADVVAVRDGTTLRLNVGTTGDSVTVWSYFSLRTDLNLAVEQIAFADGTVWTVPMVHQLTLQGSDLNDNLEGFAGNDLITGRKGNDTLLGRQGNDSLAGGEGDDTLDGGAGDDVLDGGKGRDRMVGGPGNDIFLFGKGDGPDAIVVQDVTAGKIDTVRFGANVTASDVLVERWENKLVLTIRSSGDTLFVEDYFLVSNAVRVGKIEQVQFADGSSWTSAAIDQMAVPHKNTRAFVDTTLIPMYGNVNSPFSVVLPKERYKEEDPYDILSFSVGPISGYPALPAWLNFDPVTMRLWGTPAASDQVELAFNLYGTDLYGESNRVPLKLTIGPVSVAPTVKSAIPDLVAFARTPFQLSLGEVFADQDKGDVLTYSATLSTGAVLPAWLSFDPVQRRFSGVSDTPLTVGVKVTGTDLSGKSASDVFDIVVSPNLTIAGTPGNDVLQGEGANDRIEGLAGDDQLDGGPGNDTLVGGAGNDTYAIYDQTDVIIEKENEGSDTVRTTLASYALPDNVENVVLSGEGKDAVLTGNILNNYLTAGNGVQKIDGGAGKDTMAGGAGADLYVVDSTLDVIVELAAAGYDRVDSSATYTLPANVETLTLTGEANIDATGNADSNLIVGNAGNNRLDGGAGMDRLSGMAGNDTYVIDSMNDVIEDESGIDTIERSVDSNYKLTNKIENLTLSGNAIRGYGNELDNVVIGNELNNSLAGYEGNDHLFGKIGNDTLFGGAGNDQLAGGAGNDHLLGEGGNDTYLFERGDGKDLIDNFDVVAAVDTLRFGQNIVESDIIVQREVENLVLNIKDTADSVTLLRFFAADYTQEKILGNSKIERVQFANGVIWDQAKVLGLIDSPAVNHAPKLMLPGPDLKVQVGKPFTYTVAAGTMVDPDPADSVVYSIAAYTAPLPSWLAFDPASRTLTGTPTLNDLGAIEFMLIGTDKYGLRTATLGSIVTAPTNRSPVLASALADQSNALGTAFSYVLPAGAFSDPDAGTVLSYSATLADGTALPAWLSFNGSTGAFGGTAIAAGKLSVKVTARDSENLSVSDVFDLTVSLQNQTLTGTAGADQLNAGAGNDVLNSMAGNDALSGGAGNDTLDGGAGADTMTGGAGDDTYMVDAGADKIIEGANGGADTVASPVSYILPANVENLTLTGTALADATGNELNNVLLGNAASNVLNGMGGIDTMTGGAGDDVYIVDNLSDVAIEAANEGSDTVKSIFNSTLAANIEALFLTGSAGVSGTGNTLNNLLVGNVADNALSGDAGNDLLQGGAGDDTLTDTVGNHLLDGGAGADRLTGGPGKEMLSGGAGNDVIATGGGADIIAFNRGDGQDVVNASSGKDDTVSLGKGVLYADLLFKKTANDLILVTGASEQITFKDWYAAPANRSVANLQMVIEGGSDYNATSANKLNNNKVEQFNFDGLVGAFDAARTATPAMTSWALSTSLLNFYLSGSDTAALGGDLAYQYGKNGNLSSMSMLPAGALLSSPAFGVSAQPLQAGSALRDLSPQLV
ncbi:putative Ig domain-containing protein [Massilia violaceinigra]|uniref:Ig domain-containing protein n=1 Tax=Massilia violaceinigra TaxID=2045208 RepID=A0ABY4A9N4_9BURK|nr:putative Ig domain-containing protein [Massilia violaceinigra]UOD30684.1 putative Ig domain-containing protein [Massilia violaceinigra]